MNKASVTDCSCFADATCQQLISLVLESGGLSRETMPPEPFLARLKRLVLDDPCLGCWVDKTLGRNPTTAGSSIEEEELIAGSVSDYRRLAQRLPEFLISHPPTKWIADSGISSDLFHACHLVARLRGLEASMAGELRQRQHEVIYNFAYGLSHELNNPLAIIATRAGVLARDETTVARRQMLESIVENAMRGSEMLGDLMLVARPPAYERKAVDAGRFLEQLVNQTRHWAKPYSVEVSADVGVRATLDVDEQALREAIWALIRNAIESIELEGRLAINASVAKNLLHIAIDDNGAPLSPQALKFCFDPYYSGRESGRGLGLGLTKALRIVECFSGKLSIVNLDGGGSSALVVLPCSLD